MDALGSSIAQARRPQDVLGIWIMILFILACVRLHIALKLKIIESCPHLIGLRTINLEVEITILTKCVTMTVHVGIVGRRSCVFFFLFNLRYENVWLTLRVLVGLLNHWIHSFLSVVNHEALSECHGRYGQWRFPIELEWLGIDLLRLCLQELWLLDAWVLDANRRGICDAVELQNLVLVVLDIDLHVLHRRLVDLYRVRPVGGRLIFFLVLEDVRWHARGVHCNFWWSRSVIIWCTSSTWSLLLDGRETLLGDLIFKSLWYPIEVRRGHVLELVDVFLNLRPLGSNYLSIGLFLFVLGLLTISVAAQIRNCGL